MKIRAIVVEDEEKILDLICNKILSLDDSFEIIGKAGNGQDAIEKIEELRPQIVFTDISMPVMNGMELIKQIRQMSPNTVIVIISGYSDFEYAQQAIRYGVFNYLLKPLEDDALMETLFDIKKSLFNTTVKKQRHIIYSGNYQLLSNQQEKFMLLSVCVGNMIYSTLDEEVTVFYEEQMEMISWNQVMQSLCEKQEWLVADDHAVNQKIVALKIRKDSKYTITEFAENLIQQLKKETSLSVNVCCKKLSVEQEELWNWAKRLRNVMKKRLVIGESQIFYLEEEENNRNDMIEIIKMKLNTYIKNYFISTDLEHFMDEIRVVFKYMKNNHAPQENVEKICIYVLKLLEFSEQGYEREKLEALQNRMMKNISMSISEDLLFENLLEIFATVNSSTDMQDEEEEGKLLAYIDEHFLTIESLEDVAEEFGYNYTYLSRMFKKRFGESMSKHITNKKIDLAKDMLRNQPGLKVTEVSDLCGYNDYRYFSRVFKSEVGISPNEYKEGKGELK